MYIIILRAVIIFMVVLVGIRLMGKRQVSEMQPFELVITLVIAEVACVPMSDPGLPLYYGLLPIVILLVIHYCISFVSRKSLKFRRLIDGKSVAVITPDGVAYDALKSLNMTVNDLVEATANAGYFALSDIYYAAFETNGKLSVIPVSFASPATAGDVKSDRPQQSPPLLIVIDGKAQNLAKAAVTEDGLRRILADAGVKSIKQVALATLDAQGKVYLQPKEGSYFMRDYPELAGNTL
ncbi:MAG: DUF421 domain-containing protein [Clostridiales bacterium]|jgi:uncharacterized membrane protein YcaP (DUF421 family)|nr:DUF421 domain-containing protein [Clostridiales bacterium]